MIWLDYFFGWVFDLFVGLWYKSMIWKIPKNAPNLLKRYESDDGMGKTPPETEQNVSLNRYARYGISSLWRSLSFHDEICNQDNKNIIHICIINIMDWNIWIISIIKYYYNIKSINWMIKLLNMIQCYGLKSEGKWGGGKLVWNRLAETTLKRRGRRKDRYVEHVTLLADSDEPVELLRDGSMHRLKEIQTNETKGMSRRFV